jgi:phospholipid N-methyltransferase
MNSQRQSDALLRLRRLAECNGADADRRADAAPRFARLAGDAAGNWRDRVAVSDGLFVTPQAVADLMAATLDPQPGETILEPQAGTGSLIRATLARCPSVKFTACEINPRLCQHLYESDITGMTLRQGDFLTMDVPDRFDAVIMNPPFRRGIDCAHIDRALGLLKPKGRLVSLCYDGTAQARLLRPHALTWQVLPARSFAKEGTNADVVMLTMRKKPRG